MNEREFYRIVLGLEQPWEVTEVALDAEKQKVEVTRGLQDRDVVGVSGEPGTTAGAARS